MRYYAAKRYTVRITRGNVLTRRGDILQGKFFSRWKIESDAYASSYRPLRFFQSTLRSPGDLQTFVNGRNISYGGLTKSVICFSGIALTRGQLSIKRYRVCASLVASLFSPSLLPSSALSRLPERAMKNNSPNGEPRGGFPILTRLRKSLIQRKIIKSVPIT